ncbi:hypothetical protein KEJ51_06305, partial [Candidatus Bathyarchaeota archaeon]|nr:hypothetical protein [Candidatus Bathyarchaeota archaeon]
ASTATGVNIASKIIDYVIKTSKK